MSSQEEPQWKYKQPIEPRIGDLGRSIADQWIIDLLLEKLNASEIFDNAALQMDIRRMEFKANIDVTLQNEFGHKYDAQLNTPAVQRTCAARIKFLRGLYSDPKTDGTDQDR